jgi:hypothetical protein
MGTAVVGVQGSGFLLLERNFSSRDIHLSFNFVFLDPRLSVFGLAGLIHLPSQLLFGKPGAFNLKIHANKLFCIAQSGLENDEKPK